MAENDCRGVLLLVHELHKMGYQRIRIAPGMSPSGMHWRCSISSAENVTRRHGTMLNVWDNEVGIHYSSADKTIYFGWDDAENDSPKELAQKFIKRFPNIAQAGWGDDWEYAGWYITMLRLTDPDGCPIAYADWEMPEEGLAVVGMKDPTVIPYPPGVKPKA